MTAYSHAGPESAGRSIAALRSKFASAAARFAGDVVEIDGPSVVGVLGWRRSGRGIVRDAHRLATGLARDGRENAIAVGLEFGAAVCWSDPPGMLRLAESRALSLSKRLAAAGAPGSMSLGPLGQGLLREGQPGPEQQAFQTLLSGGQLVLSLGPAAAVVKGLAALDDSVSVEDIAALVKVTRTEVRRWIGPLATQGVVVGAGGGHYRLAGRSIRDRVLPLLHGSELQSLAERYAGLTERQLADPERPTFRRVSAVARFAERSGEQQLAVDWWQKAAAISSEDGLFSVSIRCLERARALSLTMDDAEQTGRILSKLAGQLGAVRGNAHPTVVEAYRTALAQGGRSADHVQRFDILFGLQASHLVRGEIAEAQQIGERLFTTGLSDGGRYCLAHRLSGLTSFLAGDLGAAVAHYHQALAHYHPERDPPLRFRYASDQRALALAGLAWAEALLDRTALSDLRAREARLYAHMLGHAHTHAHVASVLAVRAQTLGRADEAADLAETAYKISSDHGFAYWKAWATVVMGWHASKGDGARGLAQIEQGLHDYLATGALQAMPLLLLFKADALIATGDLARAGVALARAERFTRRGGVAVFRSEVLRSAALVAREADGTASAMKLARKAYRIASEADADLLCRRAVALLADLGSGGATDFARLARIMQQRLA